MRKAAFRVIPLVSALVCATACTGSKTHGHPTSTGRTHTPSSSSTPTRSAAPAGPVTALRQVWNTSLTSATYGNDGSAFIDESAGLGTDGSAVYTVASNGAHADLVRIDVASGATSWSTPLPGRYSSCAPAVYGTAVVACSWRNNSDRLWLTAVDHSSGHPLWTRAGYDLPSGSLGSADGRIVAWTGAGHGHGPGGSLVALDPASGRRVAVRRLARTPKWLTSGGSAFYTYGPDGLTAYTGALRPRWHKRLSYNVNDYLTASSTGVQLDHMLGATDSTRLSSFDTAGHLRWTRTAHTLDAQMDPLSADAVLVQVSNNAATTVQVVDASTGRVRWQHLIPDSSVFVSAGRLVGDTTYFCDGRVLAVDAVTGALQAADGTSTEDKTCEEPMLWVHGTLVVQSDDSVTALAPTYGGASRATAQEWAPPDPRQCPFSAARMQAALAKVGGGRWQLQSSNHLFCTYGQASAPHLAVTVDTERGAAPTAAARRRELSTLAHEGFPLGCLPVANRTTSLPGLPAGSFACTGSEVPLASFLPDDFSAFAATVAGNRVLTVEYTPPKATGNRVLLVRAVRTLLLSLRR